MLFSRSRPSAIALATLVQDAAQAPELSKRTPQLRALDLRKTGTPASTAPQPTILEIRNVPEGSYLQFDAVGIPPTFSESFALIASSDGAMVILVATDAAGTHPQFELQRRLHLERNIATISLRQASREIIRSLHDAHVVKKVAASTKVEEIAWSIIEEAVNKHASDIHIETRGAYAQVFYRVFGERVEQPSISAITATEICGVLYRVHADGDNKAVDWDPKIVCNTVIERRTESDKHVQLRFSSAPIHPSGNFHAVIRILVMDAETLRPIEDIGYTAAQVDAIEEMLLGSQGMVVLVGPTNSGKSTSMQSFIERIYQLRGRSISVLTVEDPVEYILPDACQMGVPQGRKGLEDDKTGSIFGTFLKATLRQDPDVGMVGEIRDSESAESVKNLVLAGRKLLTTLHVYEVTAIFARLREIGVPDSVLYMEGFISGVICQRLVPILCAHCSIPVNEAMDLGRIRPATYERVTRVADLETDDVRVRGDGCKHCDYTGIVGRTLCAEVLVPDPLFLNLMAKGDAALAKRYWATSSPALNIDGFGITMIAHAIQKMRQGLIDPSQIETHIGRLTVDVWSGPTSGTSGIETILPAALKY